jgi:hypothetical protein
MIDSGTSLDLTWTSYERRLGQVFPESWPRKLKPTVSFLRAQKLFSICIKCSVVEIALNKAG